jgi:hypothetical protein
LREKEVALVERLVLLFTAVAIVAVMLAVVAGPSLGQGTPNGTINNNACTKGQADEQSPKIAADELPKDEIPAPCRLETGT